MRPGKGHFCASTIVPYQTVNLSLVPLVLLTCLTLCCLIWHPTSSVSAQARMEHECRRLPVYLGAPNAASYAPANSFINVLEHSPAQLVDLLRHLETNDAAYQTFFDWTIAEDEVLLPYFGGILGETLQGYRGDGMDWVCKLCILYHKHYDWLEEDDTP